MIRYLLLSLALTLSLTSSAQLIEGFEGAFPPTGWLVFDNGIGTEFSFTTTTTANTGSQAAFVRYENVTSGTAQDWLVTPLTAITGTANQLSFWQRQTFSSNFGSAYSIRVSTNSQNMPGDFTIVDDYIETDFSLTYTERIVDLSAYIGENVYIAFVMENDDGDSWYIDDVTIPDASSPPTCTNLTSPVDGQMFVPVNASLNWAAAGDLPTGYVLTVGTMSGATDILDNVDVGNVLTYDLGTLMPVTTYYVTILAYNANGSATGCVEESFTTYAANDFCDGAQSAGCGSTFLFENNENATGGSSTSCLGSIGDGLWYTYVGTGETVTVEVTTDGTWEAQIDVYESSDGTCDNITCVNGEGAGTNPVQNEFGGELGVVYFINVGPWINGDPGGQYDLSLTCSTCLPATFNLVVDATACPDFSIDVNISSLGSATTVSISNDVNGSTVDNVGLGVHTLTGFAPGDGTVNVTVTDDADPSCTVVVAISVPAVCPPSNNNCSTADVLTTNPDLSCTESLSGTVLNATASGVPDICAGTFDDDVWYVFIATNPVHQIQVNNITGSSTDLVYELFSGTCGALVSQICHDTPNAGFTASGLTPSEAYFIRVATWSSTGSQTTTFDICVGTPPPPPDNDNCATATELIVNPDLSCTESAPGSLFNSTGSGVAETCSGTFDDDVWYFFEAAATSHIIQVNNLAGSATDIVFQLLSGTCGALSQIQCHDTPNTGFTASGLTIGLTYYIRIASWTPTSGQTTTFDICINSLPPPPANDACANAVSLNVGANGTCPAAATSGSTHSSTADGTFSCDATGPNNGVWYSFVAPTSGSLNLNVTELTGNHEVVIFDACGGTSVFCDITPNNEIVSGLTGGQTYFLLVFSDAGSEGNFQICLQELPPPPDNDLCAGAETIVAMSAGTYSLMGTTTNSTIADAPASCDATVVNTTVGGVWYRIETDNDLDLTIQVCDSDFDTELSVYSGECGNLLCLDGDDDGCTTPNTIGSLINLPSGTFFQGNGEDSENRSAPTTLYAYVSGHGSSSGDFLIEVIASGVLPLEMLNFRGYVREDGNMLEWSTALEKNTDMHYIERADKPNGPWLSVGETPAAGNKQGVSQYKWMDTAPLSQAYYRIRTRDIDGEEHFSNIISLVRNTDAKFALKSIYPQPSTSAFFASVYSPEEDILEYQISNIEGKQMLDGQMSLIAGNQELSIETPGLNSGIYILRMQTGTAVLTQRLVIEQ